MITYTCFENSNIPSSSVIDFSHENNERYLNQIKILLKNEVKERCYRINFLTYTGLELMFFSENDYFLVGVDYGAAIIEKNLNIICSIKSDYLFYHAVFSRKQILIIFECELFIYDIINNSVKAKIPLCDMINDFDVEGKYFLYNTIENPLYNRIYISDLSLSD